MMDCLLFDFPCRVPVQHLKERMNSLITISDSWMKAVGKTVMLIMALLAYINCVVPCNKDAIFNT